MAHPTTTPSDAERELGILADALKQGNCTLFLGAGVHAPPPPGSEFEYPEGHRPLLGKSLARALAERTKFAQDLPEEDASNLLRVAQYYESYRGPSGRRELHEQLVKGIEAGKQPSPVVKALAELGFNYIVTTNFDTLFEKALRSASKEPFVGVYKKNQGGLRELADEPLGPGQPSAAHPFVFKIHGDIYRPESLVVSDEDYIDFILRMRDMDDARPVPMTILTQLRRAPTLFVGYRLQDYNLRVLFKTLRGQLDPARMPENISVDPWPDKLVLRYWGQRYVTFVEQNSWDFVPRLYERVMGRKLAI
jgi:hypothetical protein